MPSTWSLRAVAFVALTVVPACSASRSLRDAGFGSEAGSDGGVTDGTTPRLDGSGGGCDGACTCMAPQVDCGGACVDVTTSAAHCGDCVTTCAGGETCVAGGCVPSCGPAQTLCHDPIVVPGDDAGVPDDGGTGVDAGTTAVCADLMADPLHCGHCETQCAAGAVCVSGHCGCPPGMFPCSGRCVDLTSDPEFCGTCTTSCGAGGTCDHGMCTACGASHTMCTGGTACIDTDTDSRNCGSCGHVCPSGEHCVTGMCACVAPRFDCGAGCTDLAGDDANCGMCGHSCGPGGVCTASACTCGPGYLMCGADCADVVHDRDHCGSCTNVCPAGEVCLMGACSAAPPTHYMQTMPTAGSVPFVDACTAAGETTILVNVDDGAVNVTLPFPFRYWATDLPMGAPVNVCSNGWMSLAGGSDIALTGTVPAVGTPDAVIAPHWGDNHTNTLGVCVATIGTAPNRQFVVEWKDAYYFGGAATGGVDNTFEVILYEASGNIDLVYQTMTMARAQTTGIEDQSGAMGINACPGGVGSCIPTAGEIIRFLPIP